MTHAPVFPVFPFSRSVWAVFSFLMGILIASLFWDFCETKKQFEQMSVDVLKKCPVVVTAAVDQDEFVVTTDPFRAFERWILWAEKHQKPGSETPGI